MEHAVSRKKGFTDGEFGLCLVFACLAFFSLYVSSQAYTSAYAFHAALFCVGSAAAIAAILTRYEKRAAEPTSLLIKGKPNYNLGPVRFASLAAVFWGVAGFTVGLYIALELAFPWLNLDRPFVNFGRLRPLHTRPRSFSLSAAMFCSRPLSTSCSALAAPGSAAILRRGS